MSIGGHQSGKMLKDEWLTPPDILHGIGCKFDLDPCAPINRPWATASTHFTIEDDGLRRKWYGRVWCNPPYGRETGKWLSKLADHGSGFALVFARTETKMFFKEVWNRATALLFVEGRLHFHHSSGERAKANAGAPSVIIAYGAEESRILQGCKIKGMYISLR